MSPRNGSSRFPSPRAVRRRRARRALSGPHLPYVPEERVESIPVTTCQYVAEERVEPYEVRKCEMVAEERVESIPVTTCSYVAEERVEPYEVRTCQYVAEERVETIPVTTCEYVAEQRVERVPVTTCRMVAETASRQVPVSVPEEVPVTVNRCVARVVPRRSPSSRPPWFRWLSRPACRATDAIPVKKSKQLERARRRSQQAGRRLSCSIAEELDFGATGQLLNTSCGIDWHVHNCHAFKEQAARRTGNGGHSQIPGQRNRIRFMMRYSREAIARRLVIGGLILLSSASGATLWFRNRGPAVERARRRVQSRSVQLA